MLGLRFANHFVAATPIMLSMISHDYKQVAQISDTCYRIKTGSTDEPSSYNESYNLSVPLTDKLKNTFKLCKINNTTIKKKRESSKWVAICTQTLRDYLSSATKSCTQRYCKARLLNTVYANIASKEQTKSNATTKGSNTGTSATCEDQAANCSADQIKHSVVYTKGGDKGASALFTGERRRKNDIVFEALGALDELTSHVGLARAMLRDMMKGNETKENDCKHYNMLMTSLEDIQQQLMNVSTIVATPAADETKVEGPLLKLLQSYTLSEKTQTMEKEIDVIDARLTPLRIFILPGGGNVASAQLHVCRTVCRRAERRMVDVRDKYGEQYTDHLRQATVYVNRLSDYFFVAARSVAEEDIVRKSE